VESIFRARAASFLKNCEGQYPVASNQYPVKTGDTTDRRGARRVVALFCFFWVLGTDYWVLPYPICPRIARASAAGSEASVIGRPTTMCEAPAAIASAGVTIRA